MPDETAVPAEPSISDLRVLLNTPATDESETEAPAPAAKAAEKPASDSDPDKATEEAAAGDEADKAKADPPGVAKRIGKALQAQREAEARATAAEAKLANSGSQPAKQTAPPADLKEPDAANFDTYEKYIKALTTWQLDSRDQARADDEVSKKNAAAWKARVATAKEAHDDYEDVIAGAADTPISRVMHDAITESEVGPQLAYYLATHLDEAARIFALSPNAGAREMGKLETLIEAKANPSKNPKPAAGAKALPRPPANVGGSHAPTDVDLSDPGLSMRDFKRQAAKLLAH